MTSLREQGDHVDRIMEVMQAAFDPAYGEAWNRRQVEDALLLGNCRYGLAMAGERCVGFYLARAGVDDEELLLLAVVPGERRHGHGRKLLDDFAQSARERGAQRLLLEMRRGNPAGHLYSSFGFRPVGERKNYYRLSNDGRADAITFEYIFK